MRVRSGLGPLAAGRAPAPDPLASDGAGRELFPARHRSLLDHCYGETSGARGDGSLPGPGLPHAAGDGPGATP